MLTRLLVAGDAQVIRLQSAWIKDIPELRAKLNMPSTPDQPAASEEGTSFNNFARSAPSPTPSSGPSGGGILGEVVPTKKDNYRVWESDRAGGGAGAGGLKLHPTMVLP